jgi:hypothetical protein
MREEFSRTKRLPAEAGRFVGPYVSYGLKSSAHGPVKCNVN